VVVKICMVSQKIRNTKANTSEVLVTDVRLEFVITRTKQPSINIY
jgi:hypothetical protein